MAADKAPTQTPRQHARGRNTDKAPALSPPEARHFDIEVDMLAKANGARVAEVPIQYRQRIGKKKLKP
jgi:Glycosyltransferases involved in cell wall biogenesis